LGSKNEERQPWGVKSLRQNKSWGGGEEHGWLRRLMPSQGKGGTQEREEIMTPKRRGTQEEKEKKKKRKKD